jgi:hypothetical protein
MTGQTTIKDFFAPLATQDVRVGGVGLIRPPRTFPQPKQLSERVEVEVSYVSALPERDIIFSALRDFDYLAEMFKENGNSIYIGTIPMGIPVGDAKYIPLSTFMQWLNRKTPLILNGSFGSQPLMCEIPEDADMRPGVISVSDRFNKLGFELRFVSYCYVSDRGNVKTPPLRVVVGWNLIEPTDPFGPNSKLAVYVERASLVYWLQRTGHALGFEGEKRI